MAKPDEFFIGVIDLFAILLPGAIATAIIEPKYSGVLFGSLMSSPEGEISKWAVFLAVSYFLGHLIFLLGSYIDPIYNFLRERFHPYSNESAFQCAKRIRDSLITEEERQALNPFQWSRSVLLTGFPAAAQDVHRLEADSKFFRSLMVVSLFAGFAFVSGARYFESLIAFFLVIPCFARYYERRLKSTTQAYVHVVTLGRLGKLGILNQLDELNKPTDKF